jgi:hypothetical protein
LNSFWGEAQLKLLRTPFSLRSVLIPVHDLARVHAAPANSALFISPVSFFQNSLWGRASRRFSRLKVEIKAKREASYVFVTRRRFRRAPTKLISTF